MSTLDEPYDYSVKNAAEQTGDVIRVTLAINDRVMNGQGELQEAVKSFFVQVLVDGGSATIVGIYAGS
ncbi:MAG: hypothetical protein M1274_11585 [Actinobacteria bacterium]|nr:hypothetical protein [Actinomycetota bacterium]